VLIRDFAIVFVHLIVTLARLARLGGLRSVVAESVLVRHQLHTLNRGRKRAQPACHGCTLFMRPARVLRSNIVLKPSTLLHLHSVQRKRKYRGCSLADLDAKPIDFQHCYNAIEHMGGWKGACGDRLREELYHQLASVRTGGRGTGRGLYQTTIAA
jgi:hypothetical protein